MARQLAGGRPRKDASDAGDADDFDDDAVK